METGCTLIDREEGVSLQVLGFHDSNSVDADDVDIPGILEVTDCAE
jgi:hypothetical protein